MPGGNDDLASAFRTIEEFLRGSGGLLREHPFTPYTPFATRPRYYGRSILERLRGEDTPPPVEEEKVGVKNITIDIYPITGGDTPFQTKSIAAYVDRYSYQPHWMPLEEGGTYTLQSQWQEDSGYHRPLFSFGTEKERKAVCWQHPLMDTSMMKCVRQWLQGLLNNGTLHIENIENPYFWNVYANRSSMNSVANTLSTLSKQVYSHDDALLYLAELVRRMLIATNRTTITTDRIQDSLYEYCSQVGENDEGFVDLTINDLCAIPPQKYAEESTAQHTWQVVRLGERFGHNADPVTHLVTQPIPRRTLGIEMELEIVSTEINTEHDDIICSTCDGTGEIEDDYGDLDECNRCCGTRYVPRNTPILPSLSSVLRNVAASMPERSYLPKRDGSLDSDYGVEFVSVPMLKNECFAWLDALCSTASEQSLAGTSSCGMHIHVSRGWFQNKAHLARFYGLSHGPLRHFIERFVGPVRREELREWAHVDEENWRRVVENGAICGGHYDGVSLDGEYTVEVRFFAGTVNADIAKANVELVLAMISYSSSAGPCQWPYKLSSDLSERYLLPGRFSDFEMEFTGWVLEHRKEYKFLAKYLIEHDEIKNVTDNLTKAERARLDAVRKAKKARKEAQRLNNKKQEGKELVCV